MSSRKERPPSPIRLAQWGPLLGGLEPSNAVEPWVEALVADGESPRISGLLLLWGLVAGEHWVGRGSNFQRRLIHLQAEGWHEGTLTMGEDPSGQTQQLGHAAWSLGSYGMSV